MSDAAGLPNTYTECLPYMCGAVPFNYAVRYACSAYGFQGNLSCNAPECAPYCPNAAMEPAVRAAAVARRFQPRLTAENLVRPIPAITNPLRPVPLPDLSPICQLNQAIADHPLISTAMLVGAFALVWRGSKKGRR